jgi:hypothetical protein
MQDVIDPFQSLGKMQFVRRDGYDRKDNQKYSYRLDRPIYDTLVGSFVWDDKADDYELLLLLSKHGVLQVYTIQQGFVLRAPCLHRTSVRGNIASHRLSQPFLVLADEWYRLHLLSAGPVVFRPSIATFLLHPRWTKKPSSRTEPLRPAY